MLIAIFHFLYYLFDTFREGLWKTSCPIFPQVSAIWGVGSRGTKVKGAVCYTQTMTFVCLFVLFPFCCIRWQGDDIARGQKVTILAARQNANISIYFYFSTIFKTNNNIPGHYINLHLPCLLDNCLWGIPLPGLTCQTLQCRTTTGGAATLDK